MQHGWLTQSRDLLHIIIAIYFLVFNTMSHPFPFHTINTKQRQGPIPCPIHWYLDFSSNFLRHCFISICSDVPVFTFTLITLWHSRHNSHSFNSCWVEHPCLLFPRTSICNWVCNNTSSQDYHLLPVQTCSTFDLHFSSVCPTLSWSLIYYILLVVFDKKPEFLGI